MKNLHRLIYTSSRKATCDDGEIEKILNSCNKNNSSKDITGVLLHSEKRFLQYLEGDKSEIMQLFDTIKLDERHGGVNLRYFSPINERLFPSWHMGYKDVNKKNTHFQTNIKAEDKEIFRSLIEDKQQSETEGIRVLKLFFELS
jgi:hypothetical protein